MKRDKNIIMIILVVAIILSYIGYINFKDNRKKIKVVTTISSSEAEKIISKEENITILDVRTIEEYKAGHIKDSILISLSEIQEKVEGILKNKEQKIFVYCRSGNRSKKAAEILLELGYNNVYDFGGIQSWKGEIIK